MKKILLGLSVILTIGFIGCGGGSSEEAKALQQRILKAMGISPTMLMTATVCQDTNFDGRCLGEKSERKISISGDSVETIWQKVTKIAEDTFFMDDYNPKYPILLILEDKDRVTYNATGEFGLSFNSFTDGTLEYNNTAIPRKELSILQSMIDLKKFTKEDIEAVRGDMDSNGVVTGSMRDIDQFYKVLMDDFAINVQTLGKIGLTPNQIINGNTKEMADELLLYGIKDTLPNGMNNCNGNQECIDNILKPLSTELLITYEEAQAIKKEQESKDVDEETQEIAGITWLKAEPDGYLGWQEANSWCIERGYRLPLMSELISVWEANDGQISPEGFKKDTFYWSSENAQNEPNAHQGCAMDADCSKPDQWGDSGYGHPKCVAEASEEEDIAYINYNGISYKEVKSPHTGKTWLDRNLGASNLCTSSTDSGCYGDYYQWGRDTDGHEKPNSAISSIQAQSYYSAGDKFIIENSDWTEGDETGGSRNISWGNVEHNTICPVGYRVPTVDELKAETIDAGITSISAAFDSFLKLPSVGFRISYNGNFHEQGEVTSVWSSTPDGSQAKSLGIGPDFFELSNSDRAIGLPVRCIKD